MEESVTEVEKIETREARFFREVAYRSKDPEWEKIFLSASNNIFPQGFYYNNGCLFYEAPGQKRSSVKIPDDVGAAYRKCRDFMRKRGISTTKDHDTTTFKRQKGWSTVKRDDSKVYYFEKYAMSLQNQYNLSREEYRQLLHHLGLLLLSGEAKGDCIQFEEGQIREISRLQFDETTRRFTMGAVGTR